MIKKVEHSEDVKIKAYKDYEKSLDSIRGIVKSIGDGKSRTRRLW